MASFHTNLQPTAMIKAAGKLKIISAFYHFSYQSLLSVHFACRQPPKGKVPHSQILRREVDLFQSNSLQSLGQITSTIENFAHSRCGENFIGAKIIGESAATEDNAALGNKQKHMEGRREGMTITAWGRAAMKPLWKERGGGGIWTLIIV
jgi:hypothetical protein